jgi:hypothetical protein
MVVVVYAANLLAHEVSGSRKGLPVPEFDMEFLSQAGAADLLPKWRQIAEAAHFAETRMAY